MSGQGALAVVHSRPGAFDVDVEVRACHIAAGEVCDSGRCPFALALREALVAAGVDLADGESVKVMGSHVEVSTRDRGMFIGILDDGARAWIIAFDRGRDANLGEISCRLTLEPLLEFEYGPCDPQDEL